MGKFCELYDTLKEARTNCECHCDKPHPEDAPYYRCAHGNCKGYHCTMCGKFEVIYDLDWNFARLER